MSFDRRDLRPTLDVYTADNVYLGALLRVDAAPGRSAPQPPERSSTVSGELLGPQPTAPLGNTGPHSQAATAAYATTPDAAPLGQGTFSVGRWWGLRERRTLPLSAIQSVSLERVVLTLRRDQLDSATI